MKKAAKENKQTSPQTKGEASTSVRIVTQQEKQLSKNQRTFNQLIEEVELLHNTIKNEGHRLEQLLQEYGKKLPQEKKFAALQISIAASLDNAADNMRLSLRQTESVRKVIVWFCRQSFRRDEPTPDGIALYNKWAETTFEEEQQQLEIQRKELIAAEMKSRYGVDIDPAEIDLSPEGLARLQERIRHLAEEKHAAEGAAEAEKPRTRKQQEREQKQKAKETEKLKSLRGIYLSLAKMLHPDTATDATEKLRKEEPMKKVAAAYRDKNLQALLALELEFVATESNRIQSLADDKLKVYIASLKEQVSALRTELYRTRNNARFASISDLVNLPPKTAEIELQTKAKQIKILITEAERARKFLQGNADKKSVMGFVNSMEEDIEIVGGFEE